MAFSILSGVACTTKIAQSRPLDAEDDPELDNPQVKEGEPPPDETPDPTPQPGRVYANTNHSLYRFDPVASELAYVGEFDCVPQDGIGDLGQSETNDAVLDIAIDREGQMYGTTYWRFIKINPADATCTVLKKQDTNNVYPNSLSFVPIGTADPTKEALVGYGFRIVDDIDFRAEATDFTRIDLATGELDVIGDMNEPGIKGKHFQLSGDFISFDKDGQQKTYGAVHEEGGSTTDLLAEIDPKTGSIVAVLGDMKQTEFYGLGYWAGTAYGFSRTGGIYSVAMGNAKADLVLEAKSPQGATVEWYGGGVTTNTPIR